MEVVRLPFVSKISTYTCLLKCRISHLCRTSQLFRFAYLFLHTLHTIHHTLGTISQLLPALALKADPCTTAYYASIYDCQATNVTCLLPLPEHQHLLKAAGSTRPVSDGNQQRASSMHPRVDDEAMANLSSRSCGQAKTKRTGARAACFQFSSSHAQYNRSILIVH